MLLPKPNLVAPRQTVWAYVAGSPKTSGKLMLRPIKMGTRSARSSPVKIWSVSVKTYGCKQGPKNCGDAGVRPLKMGCVWPSGNTPLSHKCYQCKFGRSRLNWLCVITEILRKTPTLRVQPFTQSQQSINQSKRIYICRKQIRGA